MYNHHWLDNEYEHYKVGSSWDLLYDVTYNIKSREVKFYFFNSSLDFMFKVSNKGLEKQFSAYRVPIHVYPLQQFLGDQINLDEVIVDAADLQLANYYLMIEEAAVEQCELLFQVLLEKFQISETHFLAIVNYLNETQVSSLRECAEKRCLSCIRVPLTSNRLKIYARSFRFHQFTLDAETKYFLHNLLGCNDSNLLDLLDTGGMSYDFSDERVVLFTQYDALKALR